MPTKRKTRSGGSSATSKLTRRKVEEVEEEIAMEACSEDSAVECEASTKREAEGGGSSPKPAEAVRKQPLREVKMEEDGGEESQARFLGEAVTGEEARRRWPKRYEDKKQNQRSRSSKDDDDDQLIQARCHYVKAEVDGPVYDLYDDAHVRAGDGEDDFICQIVEMLEAVDGTPYFTAQWYYRANDTVIQDLAHLINKKRVFFSKIQNDNPLECLVKKLHIARVPLKVGLEADEIPKCDFYCDMMYLLPYSTFTKLLPESKQVDSETSSTISSEDEMNGCKVDLHKNSELTLLDLYSGCGAMSTGLCLGANMAGSNLVTKWAVDLNQYACESLKLNHPETEVRNESAEDFLSLLKEWERLCVSLSFTKRRDSQQEIDYFSVIDGQDEDDDDNDNDDDDDVDDSNNNDDNGDDDSQEYEVKKLLQICFGDPNESGERGLYFMVRWKNYGPKHDTWEPITGLSDCRKRIREFVIRGYESKILPLPGEVDVICGGPPCQSISGFNRFRNKSNPLADEKNKQLVIFMEIVEFLRPRFVLMENVVDLVKFAKGYLGRYALGRLIQMNYQARMGMMAAGAYGLPQFRMRVFLWGAQPTEKLPQYPLPTHDVVLRGVIPTEFERNTVAYDEGQSIDLETKLLLKDAISDLPAVGNYEKRDEISYDKESETEFQRYIRLSKNEMLGGSSESGAKRHLLYDHFPYELNIDDYQRVCRIPKRKGACFRDLPGVRVRPDNKVEWDPDVERVYLESGKPLVPNYAMTFVDGTSSKPSARLWWDETVPTVVTRAEPHNQAITHPEQDRVLAIRENARLQGFPDYYKLCGPVKERYIQVGNAVAVPVARALGYALDMAIQGPTPSEDPLLTLPKKFPNISEQIASASSEDVA
uniref:Cytosine-specific methyltransferase n=1 Tax=Litchi chinensis TaxID=151069 RepID=A0A221C710_LITCN|nr:DNA (cytosine-5)-methyltransferase chromomethylase [Litchi chinensis]